MPGASTVEAEFRDFVAARSAALHRTAYLLVGDWGLAEDLVQVALVKTYLIFKRTEIGAVEAYTRKVLVNTATKWWRRRWRGERPSEVLPERPATDHTDRWLEQDRMWRLIRALPSRQRAVVVLRFYEDLTEAATAQTLGVSVGTVKSHTARALATLRQQMQEPPPEQPAVRPAPDRTAVRAYGAYGAYGMSVAEPGTTTRKGDR